MIQFKYTSGRARFDSVRTEMFPSLANSSVACLFTAI